MADAANPQKIPGFGLRGSFGTSKVGGFGDASRFRLMVKGLCAETGQLLMSRPVMSDFVFRDDAGVCTLRSKGEFFLSRPLPIGREAMIDQLLTTMAGLVEETGFYVVNHANMQAKFLGKTWGEVVLHVQGKYLGDGPLEAIQDHPTDSKRYQATAANRWGYRFEDHA